VIPGGKEEHVSGRQRGGHELEVGEERVCALRRRGAGLGIATGTTKVILRHGCTRELR